MEAGSELGARQMAGFKDFYQAAQATRVIAGRDLLSSTGFELSKEGAHRVFIVTDRRDPRHRPDRQGGRRGRGRRP